MTAHLARRSVFYSSVYPSISCVCDRWRKKTPPSSYAANIRPHVDVGFSAVKHINTRPSSESQRVLCAPHTAHTAHTRTSHHRGVCVHLCSRVGKSWSPCPEQDVVRRAASRVGHRAIESDRSHRAVGMTHCRLDGACGRPVPPRVKGARTISNAAASRARRWQLGQCRRASLQRCGEAANAAERRRLSVAHGERSWLLPQISCAGRASW